MLSSAKQWDAIRKENTGSNQPTKTGLTYSKASATDSCPFALFFFKVVFSNEMTHLIIMTYQVNQVRQHDCCDKSLSVFQTAKTMTNNKLTNKSTTSPHQLGHSTALGRGVQEPAPHQYAGGG